MLTKAFWAEALERALKTFAQALIAIVSVDGLGLHQIDWPAGLSVAALATLVSILTSVVSAGPGPSAGEKVEDEKPVEVIELR